MDMVLLRNPRLNEVYRTGDYHELQYQYVLGVEIATVKDWSKVTIAVPTEAFWKVIAPDTKTSEVDEKM